MVFLNREDYHFRLYLKVFISDVFFDVKADEKKRYLAFVRRKDLWLLWLFYWKMKYCFIDAIWFVVKL
jgi:hypothetical protein